ncbi:hypothetical protein [Oscillatoria sp. FACHB-1406]|uniref:hypothetical protein n=1 Tax=Oscillatoria sp. FACHB-1406 TaxID=2692846 RepID=UPI0016849E8E|nr:hypothetical protein [Oscillatoria sp. FACHB-1406]MBD2577583.1 hypothetical protein [Oscillatoria sp. FACHB-1406]
MKLKVAISLSIAFSATVFLTANSARAFFNPLQFFDKHCASDCPSSASQLIAQTPSPFLEDTLKFLFRDDYFDVIPYHFTQFDLNDDNLEESIVFYTQTERCSNRSCPVHVLEPAEGGEYNLIGDLWGQRGTQVALLRSKTRGWHDLAIPLFSYEPRGLYWTVVKFNGSQYEMTDVQLESLPPGSRIILDVENSPAFAVER